jgi:hypothetical protein
VDYDLLRQDEGFDAIGIDDWSGHVGTLLAYQKTMYSSPFRTTRSTVMSASGPRRSGAPRWIRDGGAFDAVVNFDRALRDPAHPARMLPIYDCGDHLHSSDLGYNAMGDAVDLALFD